MNPGSRRESLPKAWPKSVKMAVLHVVALAHTAIVQARSIALCSPDDRTRRAGDLQGALDEMAMLEEELRIKDGRMAMIDPHRRPHDRRLLDTLVPALAAAGLAFLLVGRLRRGSLLALGTSFRGVQEAALSVPKMSSRVCSAENQIIIGARGRPYSCDLLHGSPDLSRYRACEADFGV